MEEERRKRERSLSNETSSEVPKQEDPKQEEKDPTSSEEVSEQEEEENDQRRRYEFSIAVEQYWIGGNGEPRRTMLYNRPQTYGKRFHPEIMIKSCKDTIRKQMHSQGWNPRICKYSLEVHDITGIRGYSKMTSLKERPPLYKVSKWLYEMSDDDENKKLHYLLGNNW